MAKNSGDLAWYQTIGILVFVFCCGIPGLEAGGFGDLFGLDFDTAIIIATVGGLVGGALICPRPIVAGLVGGVIAGPLGLYAVYFYVQQRDSVFNIELVLVQGLASLPGLGVGFLLKKLFAPSPAPRFPSDDEEEVWREVE